jgi:hypothetical protein
MIDLNEYTNEILAACELSHIRKAHREMVVEFTSQSYVCEMEDSGMYLTPMDGWRFTTSSFWDAEIHDRIEAAAEKDDEEAHTVLAVEFAAMLLEERGYEKTAMALYDHADEMAECFHPKGVDSILPRHSCYYAVQVQLLIASVVFPDREWIAVQSPLHAFLVDGAGRVFDMLLFDGGLCRHHENAKPILEGVL